MATPDIETTREAIKAHMENHLTDYYVGDTPEKPVELMNVSKFANVFHTGGDIMLDEAEMPVRLCFTATWVVIVGVRGGSPVEQSKRLDNILPEILDVLNPPGNGNGEAFGMSNCWKAYVTRWRKLENDTTGLYWEILLELKLDEV